jgi:anti-anti-sigma factor
MATLTGSRGHGPASHPPLSIEASYRPPGSTLRCAGEIDASNVTGLERTLETWVEAGVPELAIDLRQVRYLDTDTVEALLCAHHQLARQGGRLRVRTSRNGTRLLHLLGLDRVLMVDPARH